MTLTIDKPIDRIWLNDKEYFKVGMGGVTHIEIVMVAGQMAEVPWYAVWSGEKLHSIWNSAKINGVVFKTEFKFEEEGEDHNADSPS